MDVPVELASQALVVIAPAIMLFGLWLVATVVQHALRSRSWLPTPATITEIATSRAAQLPWFAPDDRTLVPIDSAGDVRWQIRYAFQDPSGRTRDGVARWHSDLPPAVGDDITVLVSPRLSRSSFVDFNPVVRAVGGTVVVAVGLSLLVTAIDGLRG